MEIPQNYIGREHSLIKHALLKAYLERLFMIIGQVEESICYVDCFAGPWQSKDENLTDTSVGIAFDIIKKCREALYKKFNRKVLFKALFIEKRKDSFNKLECFCHDNSCNTMILNCIKGEFYDLRHEILNWCGTSDFVFFFIDPKGWKNAIEIPTLSPLLKRPRSEFLINFMFPFLIRTVPIEKHKDDIISIFGFVPVTDDMTTEEKELYLLHKYREYIKSESIHGIKLRSAYVKVKHPIQERTKYDLVYFSCSPKGITVFFEESEKLDWIQRSLRAEIQQDYRENKSGQMEIFEALETQNHEKTCPDIVIVKNYWLKQLSYTPKVFGITQLADMLEETGWFISDFQRAFSELLKKGIVENLNAKKKRPKHPIHFSANTGRGEFLRIV